MVGGKIITQSSNPTDIYGRSNLTELQLLYWVGQKIRPSDPLFNNVFVFTFNSRINQTLFAKAFTTLVSSSDALQTVIEEIDHVPQRRILSQPPCPLHILDFSAEPDPGQALQDWVNGRCRIALPIAEYLYDSALIKLNSERFVWYLNQHHLITDAPSIFLIFRQVVKLYKQALAGEQLIVKELFPFEKHVAAKHKYNASRRYKQAAAYWDKKLAQAARPVQFFKQDVSKSSTFVHRVIYQLDQEHSEKLRSIARQEAVQTTTDELTLFNIFSALLFAFLHATSGNKHPAFITTIHNRPTIPAKNTIGVLMELCPMLATIAPDETFLSLIGKVNADMRHTMIHYRYGSRIALQNNAFNVMFTYLKRPELRFMAEPVKQEIIHPGCGSESFALHVHEFEKTNAFTFYLDFHQDIFTAEQRDLAVSIFIHLIDAFLGDPQQTISQFQISDSASQNQSLWQQPPPPQNGNHPAPTRKHIPPRHPIEFQLQQIWENVLSIKGISIRDDFFEIGGESWQAMSLFVKIEETIGARLPLAMLLEARTIEEMGRRLRQETDIKWESVLTIQKGDPGKRPIFIFPGAAGNNLVVSRIANHLHPSQPVCSFIISGLVDDQEPLTQIDAMAKHYINALQTIQPEGPYLLGGFSAGGIIALEAAQQLQAQRHDIDLLAVIDMPILSPRFKNLHFYTERFGKLFPISEKKQWEFFIFFTTWISRVYNWRQRGGNKKIQHLLRKIWHIGDTFQEDIKLTKKHGNNDKKIFQENKRAPEIAGSELEDLRTRALFAIIDRAAMSYVPRSYTGKVVLFKRLTPESGLQDPQLGWGKVTTDLSTVNIAADSHMGIVREPAVTILGQRLQQCLNHI